MAFSIGRLSIITMAGSSAAAGYVLEAPTADQPKFEVGFHLVKCCWGELQPNRHAVRWATLGTNCGSQKFMPGTIPIIAPRSESSISSDLSLLEPCSTGRPG